MNTEHTADDQGFELDKVESDESVIQARRAELLAQLKEDINLDKLVKQQASTIQQLRDELLAARRDADRYLFLRNHDSRDLGLVGLPVIAVPEAHNIGDFVTGENADKAIDALNTPKCNKCGVEVTTGMMALFCPQDKSCEFYVPEIEDLKSCGINAAIDNKG